jgi:phage baseplate assembly protein W
LVNRSDKFTIISKTSEQYSDFLVNFDKNPMTGFLARVTNEASVSQSFRNLIMTERTERFYKPHLGSKIRSLLFEPIDTVTEALLKTTIKETCDNGEPRARILQIDLEGKPDYNAYFINIYYECLNIPGETFNLSLVLKRVR